MDERSEQRTETSEPAMVTVLDEPEAPLPATVANYSPSGMRLLLDRPMRFDAPVKIEWGNRLLLGEVCYSRPEGHGFSVGISLLQALFDVAEVQRLSRGLLGEKDNSAGPVRRPEAN
jgi:hypothetical protein